MCTLQISTLISPSPLIHNVPKALMSHTHNIYNIQLFNKTIVHYPKRDICQLLNELQLLNASVVQGHLRAPCDPTHLTSFMNVWFYTVWLATTQ